MTYPAWKSYPSHLPAPPWAAGVVDVFAAARANVDSTQHHGLSSDTVLAHVRPGLEELGFEVERGKKHEEKIHRPVLFGENGATLVRYEVDAYLREYGVVVEVEAGRGAANNADYRDLVRASLMVDADYLVLAMMQSYRAGATRERATPSYEITKARVDAIYASERLMLQLKGVLLIGY